MPKWLNDAVFYEVYPPSFCDSNGDGIGDIPGMISKLDYIRDLGCNAIWLNPWYESPFRDGGYDITDYFKIAPRYGTNDDAKRFFAEAHARGMRVICDLVVCHTALEHPWFEQACRREPNDYTDYYIWSPLLSWRGDPTDQDDYYVSGWGARGSYKASFFAVQPALNFGFNQVKYDWEMPYDHPTCRRNRELIKQIMRFWLDLGCDGFRVDMAHSIVKRDPGAEKTIEFWQEVRALFDREYPEAVLVSEWFDPKKSLRGGFHIDFAPAGTIFRNDDWMRLGPAAEEVIFSETAPGSQRKWIKNYLESYREVGDRGYISIFSGNHDLHRLAKYGSPRLLAVDMALLLTFPGCPFLYYGDEIGMRYIEGLVKEGGESRSGSRTPMQWSRHAPNLGFSTAAADQLYLPVDPSADAPVVDEALAGGNPLFDAVRALIALRHARRSLRADGAIHFVPAHQTHLPMTYVRECDGERTLVVLNPGDQPGAVKLHCRAAAVERLAGVGEARIDGRRIAVEIPAVSFAVFGLED